MAGFLQRIANSLVITVGATLLAVVASYAVGLRLLALPLDRAHRLGLLPDLIRMLPPIVMTLPLFPIVDRLHLNDTHLLLIILYATFFVSLNTWIMKAFIDQIPRELDESARSSTAPPNAHRVARGAAAGRARHDRGLGLRAGLLVERVPVRLHLHDDRGQDRTADHQSEMLGALDRVEWGVLFAAATLQLLPSWSSSCSSRRT